MTAPDTTAADDALAAKAARERRYDLRTPLIRQIYDVMQAIEKCGASRELTDAVTLAGALFEPVRVLLEERDAQSREIADLRARAERAEAVIEAATFANFCPEEGGYKEGRAVEDCYEQLHRALCEFYGVSLGYDHPWWTEDEMRAAIAQTASGEGERGDV